MRVELQYGGRTSLIRSKVLIRRVRWVQYKSVLHMYFRQMVKAQKKESLLHGDVEQHGQITHGEWYLRSHRRRVYDDSGIEDDNIRKGSKKLSAP